VLQAIDGGQGIDPELQTSGFDQILAGAEGGADETAGVMHTGAAGDEISRTGSHKGIAELLGARQCCHLQWGLGGLIGDAEVAASVAVVAPSRWVRCVIGDARHREGPAIHRGNMAAGAREDDRMV
jgi:hypothetical protein